MKICTKCEDEYPLPLHLYFNRKGDTKDGYQRHCKKCVAVFHKQHYQDNKQYYLDKGRKHNLEYRIRNQQYKIDYLKQHPCVDCGETDPIVLEFDHRENKSKNLSEMDSEPLNKIIEEIAKCDIRCANCHRRKTAKDFCYYKDIQL